MTTHDLDLFYDSLQDQPAVVLKGHLKKDQMISPSVILKIHALMRGAFRKAVAWKYITANPAENVTLPKYSCKERASWSASEVKYALAICENPVLKLAMLLALGCSMRIGEILGLTWDCVELSSEALEAETASLSITKELKRCQKSSLEALEKRGRNKTLFVFPTWKQTDCTTALVLKPRGHIPTLFEKSGELGGLFLTASAMTFKENDKELIRWYLKEIEREGIDVRLNTEVNDLGTMRGYDEIIVATGSVPRTMPGIKGFEKALTFTQILKEKHELGDKVLFIGGGQSSCEAAYDLLLNYGKHPIIVEYANDLVAAQATCLANTSYLRDAMEYHKVPVYLHSTVTEITDKGCTVKNVQTGETFFVECDNVVNGIGFVPTPVGGRTASRKVKGKETIFRVGDCVAIGNLRTVIWRAWDVCMKI